MQQTCKIDGEHISKFMDGFIDENVCVRTLYYSLTIYEISSLITEQVIREK